MLSLSDHSRRAFFATAAALAAAPVASTRAKNKRKKGKKKKPPASLAFAVALVTDIALNASAGLLLFSFEAVYRHPASGVLDEINGTEGIDALTLGDASRAQIVRILQGRISIALESAGHDVPADRIAVTLL